MPPRCTQTGPAQTRPRRIQCMPGTVHGLRPERCVPAWKGPSTSGGELPRSSTGRTRRSSCAARLWIWCPGSLVHPVRGGTTSGPHWATKAAGIKLRGRPACLSQHVQTAVTLHSSPQMRLDWLFLIAPSTPRIPRTASGCNRRQTLHPFPELRGTTCQCQTPVGRRAWMTTSELSAALCSSLQMRLAWPFPNTPKTRRLQSRQAHR